VFWLQANVGKSINSYCNYFSPKLSPCNTTYNYCLAENIFFVSSSCILYRNGLDGGTVGWGRQELGLKTIIHFLFSLSVCLMSYMHEILNLFWKRGFHVTDHPMIVQWEKLQHLFHVSFVPISSVPHTVKLTFWRWI